MTTFALRCMTVLGAMAALGLPVSSCGRGSQHGGDVPADERSHWVTYEDTRWGYSVRFLNSWHRAAEPVSPKLTDPREILSLATFPLRYRPTDCESFGGAALQDMGRDDVFLTAQERGYDRDSHWRDFPPRPERFGPTEARPSEGRCGDPPGTTIHWRNFTDVGRHLHSLVAIGPDAPVSVRKQAWEILNSLRLDSDRRPTWPTSG